MGISKGSLADSVYTGPSGVRARAPMVSVSRSPDSSLWPASGAHFPCFMHPSPLEEKLLQDPSLALARALEASWEVLILPMRKQAQRS